MQFARVAHATDFIYCYTILESNKRSEYAPNNTEGRGHLAPSNVPSAIHPTVLRGNVNPELNTFFPFDPYRLPKSHSYIQGIYREWSSVAIDDDEDDDEDDEDESDDEQQEEGKGDLGSRGYLDIPNSGAGEDDNIGESLGKMSISPAHIPTNFGVLG